MAQLYGRTFTRTELSRSVGHMSQIAGARACVLTGGLANGVEAVDVRTGTGFEFTVLPGRALDIAWASYNGKAVGYMSKTGVVAAPYFQERGYEGFLRNFFAGLLTTGGLTNIGVPSQDGDASLGLHGRISNIPAEDVRVSQAWLRDEYIITVAGTVRQAKVFGECLLLHREITTRLGSNSLRIRDIVENGGSKSEPLMVLYHCNFGFPVVSASSRLYTSGGHVVPRDGTAADSVVEHDRFSEPQAGYVEQCFYHDLHVREDKSYAAIYNEDLGFGAYVRYRRENLPWLVEWKMLGEHEYVVGLEPSSGRLEGRAEALRQNQIRLLGPGEERIFEVEIGILDGRPALDGLR